MNPRHLFAFVNLCPERVAREDYQADEFCKVEAGRQENGHFGLRQGRKNSWPWRFDFGKIRDVNS